MDETSTPPAAAVPASAIDPVCGKTVQPGKTLWFIHHGSHTFYLCSLSCALAFQSRPDAYAAAALDASAPLAAPPGPRA